MEQNSRNVVGTVIRRLRNEKNLTQEMLSARCGVAGYEISRGTLAKIEAQIRCITDVELFAISEALGVRMEDLFPFQFKKQLKAGKYAREE